MVLYGARCLASSQWSPSLRQYVEASCLALALAMRRAAKVDSNHGGIVKALRDAGCGVLSLAAIGKGCPDLLAHGPLHPWTLHLLEIKDGNRPPSERKLTKDQQEFHAKWKGSIHVVMSPAEALEVFGIT